MRSSDDVFFEHRSALTTMGKSFIRLPQLCALLLLVQCRSCVDTRTRHPPEVRRTQNAVEQVDKVWSTWSAWSPCSRSCGGGVQAQSRECIDRPTDPRSARGRRRRRLDAGRVDSNRCIGVYKRYHLCNERPCPVERDFRAEQCAMFNRSPFRGRFYFWEPYTKAGECVLNCRAVGMGFYAQLNGTVWDGTPCARPTTAASRPAPPGTRGVCVEGSCKSVSKEGVVGAVSPSRQPELCSECSGGCKSESLLFLNPILPPGYSTVGTVPKGACRITISQLKQTRNVIALRHPNGTYFLNGPNDVGKKHETHLAGTTFAYRRQDGQNLEFVSAKGPLSHPVDIALLYNQPNPGVKYEYMIPADHAAALPVVVPVDRPFVVQAQNDETRNHHHGTRRLRRRKFVWKIIGMTECSRTCGGGTQYPKVACIRETTQTMVQERRCAGIERPYNRTINCNLQPCPTSMRTTTPTHGKYFWGGTWSACSATCGPGEQTRVPVCMQQLTATLDVPVQAGLCVGTQPVATRRCEIASCDPRDNELEQEPTAAQWHTGGWSQCSVTCGSGQRSRSVTCSGQCRPQDKPSTAEACHGPPCHRVQSSVHTKQSPYAPTNNIFQTELASASHRLATQPNGPAVAAKSNWLVTEWSESCSDECGTGTQTRWVACPTGECDLGSKPESRRACSSDKHCGGRWYTGPWGACEDGCQNGQPTQRREVLCVVHIRGQIRVVSDMTCPHHERPTTSQPCPASSSKCHPRWHTGEWSQCDSCNGNTGFQKREVRCLDHHGRPSSGCHEELPELRRKCLCQEYKYREISQMQNEPPPDEDDDCRNTIPNCTIIIQGRMCRVPVYHKQCCASCRRAQQYPGM